MNSLGISIDDNNPVTVDIQRIIDGRMLLQANSGGGKSYAVRKFAEITHGKVQQIIIDIEGEFASLREKYDYILVGQDGDIPINIRAADLLAKRLLELNTSAIIDLYELKHHERKRFVKLFLDSMINSPKELWHPCIVIIDEAHIFAPEKSSGEAESLDSVKDLATRGRKRGFALIAATQRLSKLNKDVVAELNTKLIGRSSLDVDMKRAAFELGFTDKADILSLRTLEKGEFYAFGPALTSKVTKIKVGVVETKHAEAGVYKKVETATPDKVKQILSKLADLPQAAEQEIKTKEEMLKKITELKREIISLKKSKPTIDLNSIKNAEHKGFKTAEMQYQKQVKTLESTISKLQSSIVQIQKISHTSLGLKIPEITPIQKVEEKIASLPVKQNVIVSTNEIESYALSGPEKLILTAIAQRFPQEATKQQISIVSGYSIKSSGFNNNLSHLNSTGMIQRSNGIIKITENGLQALGSYDPLETDPEKLLDFWCDKLGTSCGKILRAICDAYPNTITKEEVAEKAAYSVTSSGFNNNLAKLNSSNLIERLSPTELKASKELFP